MSANPRFKKPGRSDQPYREASETFDLYTGGEYAGDGSANFDNPSQRVIGGNDTFNVRASGLTVTVFGEKNGTMSNGIGGNDKFYGGENGSNTFYGDVNLLTSNKALGGNDKFYGGNANNGQAFNFAAGDANSMDDGAIGGNDDLHGGDAFGGVSSYALNALVGDAVIMEDGSRGGHDDLHGGDGRTTYGYVDGYAFNSLSGDAQDMYRGVIGGNDELEGGDGYAVNFMFGDAGGSTYDAYDFGLRPPVLALDGVGGMYASTGGNDELEGGDGYAINIMVGDGYAMYDGSRGGSDEIEGGDGFAFNEMYGDAYAMDGGYGGVVYGGNDELEGGDNGGSYYSYYGGYDNFMVGDAYAVSGDYMTAYGGNDELESGSGDDAMFGDFVYDFTTNSTLVGGSDKFSFDNNNGADVVFDFSAVDGDVIDLSDFDLDYYLPSTSYASVADWVSDMITYVNTGAAGYDGEDAVIDFSLSTYDIGTGTITLVGVDVPTLDSLVYANTSVIW